MTTIGIRRVIRGNVRGLGASNLGAAATYTNEEYYAAAAANCPANLTDSAASACRYAVLDCLKKPDVAAQYAPGGVNRASCLAATKRAYAAGPFKTASATQAPALPGYSFSATEQAAILAYWRRVGGSSAKLRGLMLMRGLGLTEAQLAAQEAASEDARDDYEAAQAAAASAGGTVVITPGPRSGGKPATTAAVAEDPNLRVAVARVFADFCGLYSGLCTGGVMTPAVVTNFGGFLKIVAVLNKRLDDAAAAIAVASSYGRQTSSGTSSMFQRQTSGDPSIVDKPVVEKPAKETTSVNVDEKPDSALPGETLQVECQAGYVRIGNECLPIEIDEPPSKSNNNLLIAVGAVGFVGIAAFIFSRRK